MSGEQKRQQVAQPHDSSYRYLLSSKKLFVELLRSFVRRGWVDELEADDVEAVDHTFILPDFRRKEADLVYRVRLRGREFIFFLLLELQSTVDAAMPYRLLLYQTEIWRYELRERRPGERGEFKLPAIVPIVLYNGERPWTAKRRFRQLVEGEAAFGPELLDFEYLLIDVERYTEAELLALSNTIGAVFLLDQKASPQQLRDRLGKLLGTMRAMPADSQSRFMTWLANIVSGQLPDGGRQLEELLHAINENKEEAIVGLRQNLETMRSEAVQEGLRLGMEQGREQGIGQGIEQGIEQAASRMLAMGLEDAFILEATGISRERLLALRTRRS